MNKNLRNKLVAASIGAALVLAPTAAFAKTTLTPSLALSPAKAKMGSVDHAADKVARTAYRAALKVWQDTRNKAQVDYKASILAYRAAIKTNKESRKQIEVTFNVAVNAATTGTVTAAARQAALNARVAAVAAATNVRAAAIIALPTLPIKLPAPTVAPKPVSPGAPVKP
jgi:hypothetical protein